ncbi:hypothetical protein FBQ81_03800 [Chloroflexi bacterium CFX6]|nr:hypothetical protein [Chloroflexi bacterium CFX6]
MEEYALFDREALEMMSVIAGKGINHAADGLSGMIGRRIQVNSPSVEVTPVLTIPELIGRPEEDAVGIYLRFKGDLAGQIMMIFSRAKAVDLVDLLVGVPRGASQNLSPLERSALGELGNLCGSFFLNFIAGTLEIALQPSPPVVMVDMVGAMLDVIVATSDSVGEYALLFQANFTDGDRCVDAVFWVIPEMNSLRALIRKHSGS